MSTEDERREEFEDECFRKVQRSLADDAVLRGEMETRGRHLVSLSLDRSGGAAEIVAELTLDGGSPLTERYGIWSHGDRPPNSADPGSPGDARHTGFMIAMSITKL